MKTITKITNDVDISMSNLKHFENSIALRYQEASKYDKFSFLQERERILLYSSPVVIRRAVKPYKTYPSKPCVQLGAGISDDDSLFLKLISGRRSRRIFQNYRISTTELYKILHYSYGITGEAKVQGCDEVWHYRAVPSAGALYPLETYVYVNHSSIPRGLYHYRPDTDSLERISETEGIEHIEHMTACGNMEISACSCVIFITSLFQRCMIKYAERGYRFMLCEVGAVTQNISLICESLNLSSCILGGYQDDGINEFLGVITPVETIQGIMVIGK